MLPEGFAARLASQLDCLSRFERAAFNALTLESVPGKWTAHENLAHLARCQHAFLHERLRRLLSEDQPALPRYRAEDDPEWPQWRTMSPDQVFYELRAGRRRLVSVLNDLTDEQLRRTGTHSLLGTMTIPEWLDFFLIHEGHHLYVAATRLRL
jgi:uncharacterized damage-inducible protein DinB